MPYNVSCLCVRWGLNNTNPSITTKFINTHNLPINNQNPTCTYTMCVPSMGIWYRRYHNIPEGAMPVPTNVGIPYRQVCLAC